MRFVTALVIAAASAAMAQTPLSEFERAVVALNAGDYAAAEAGFRRVLAASPRHIGSLQNLGLVYSRTNRLDQAVDVYRQALALRPEDPGLLSNLALAYIKKQAFADAMPVFQKLLEVNPDAPVLRDPELFYVLCQGYLKPVPEANATVDELLKGAKPAIANFVRCRLDFEAGKFEEAADHCRQALAAGTNDSVAAYNLGVALMKDGSVEKGIPYLERAIRLDPKFWGSYYYLGKARLQTHQPDQAVPLLRQAVVLNAGAGVAWYELGRALLAIGQNAEAEAAMQRNRQLRELDVARDVEMLRRK